MHVLWPIFHFQLNVAGKKTVRYGLSHILLVRSRSGKKGKISKLIVLHKMGIDSIQLVTWSLMESNDGLCFALRGLDLLKIEFENLTSSILNSFFRYNLAKKEVSLLNLICEQKAIGTITYIPFFEIKKTVWVFSCYINKNYFFFGGQNPNI